jgi:biopolymer transport protein ExbD
MSLFRVRRSPAEPRIELAPLIDVMLFLLTFFIYSVMERVDLVPMELRTYRSGQAATPLPAATISVDLDGALYLDRTPVALDGIVDRLEELRTESPDLVVYLALADGASTVDRSALLLEIWDRLMPSGFQVNIVGRKNRGAAIVDDPLRVPSQPAVGPTAPPSEPSEPTVGDGGANAPR